MALNIFQLLKAYDYSNQALEKFDCSSLFNKKLINNNALPFYHFAKIKSKTFSACLLIFLLRFD